ncbi:hypothetical protein [Corynebacterium flavescens]|uniref:hypothetical protein n=1 Tax=Corynebacterium flavescens TaxID=28028 RepID=UPI00264A4E1F|nr:hypothetical protein [Corynebacterium flavescens]MDN6199375.1 hypothetical protein [Corynebacterium flavescens]MDN6226887.1 hypothetical protein [Corynebacterium flavescens]
MLVGRSLSELGHTLRWTDLRAFISTQSTASNFWRAIAPEEATEAQRRTELLKLPNQLLTMIHDAIWDVAYARAGADHRPPRLLADLLAGGESPSAEAAPASDVEREEKARTVAAQMRSQLA